jgi:acyl-coenzyme A thioesterase PaaI-like protein
VTTDHYPTLKPSIVTLRNMQQRRHPGCWVCGARDSGLELDFRVTEDGAVEATFDCGDELQSYPDRLHGGMIGVLIDGAMTNCLFAHGVAGVTAQLKVRFRQPASLGQPGKVRSQLVEESRPLFRLRAEVVQEGSVVATAEATFADMDALDEIPFRTPNT